MKMTIVENRLDRNEKSRMMCLQMFVGMDGKTPGSVRTMVAALHEW
jgi:hypothetical protein